MYKFHLQFFCGKSEPARPPLSNGMNGRKLIRDWQKEPPSTGVVWAAHCLVSVGLPSLINTFTLPSHGSMTVCTGSAVSEGTAGALLFGARFSKLSSEKRRRKNRLSTYTCTVNFFLRVETNLSMYNTNVKRERSAEWWLFIEKRATLVERREYHSFWHDALTILHGLNPCSSRCRL